MTRQGGACFSDQDALEWKVEMLSECLRKVGHFVPPPYVDGDQHLGRGILGDFLPNAPHSLLTRASNAQECELTVYHLQYGFDAEDTHHAFQHRHDGVSAPTASQVLDGIQTDEQMRAGADTFERRKT
jgi:hypothetical protein